MTQKLQAISVIKNLNTDELVNCLNNNGFGDLEDIIIKKNLDGEKLLNLSEFQIGLWRLSKNVTKRLQECIDMLQRDPEKFTGRQTVKFNRRQSFISDHSSQNNATRKKLEQFFTMPSQKKPSIPPRNFPPVCNTDNGNNGNDEYLCMERPKSEPELPDYDEQGYLNPSALNHENDNDYEPSPVVKNDSQVNRRHDFINEPEEQYKNVPKPIKPKLPPRIKVSSARLGTTTSSNNENKLIRNTNRNDIPPPIPKRDGSNDATVLTRRIFKSSDESVQKSTPLSNPILSWIKEKQPTIKRSRANHSDDKFKTADMNKNETNEDNEEENIYEQEPLPSSPQNQKQNVPDWPSTKSSFSNGFLNRPLPQIPLPKNETPKIISKYDDKLYQNNNEEKELTKETLINKRTRSPRTTSTLKDPKNPIISTNNGDDIQQKNHDLALELAKKIKINQSSVSSSQPLRVAKTFKGSEESIPSENDEDSLYKNDSVALEVMKKRLEQHRLHGGFNDSTAKLRVENTEPPSSLRNRNTSPNKVVSTTSSNESLVSKKGRRISTSSEAEPEARYENFETRSNRSEECDFDSSIKSSSLSNISFNPIALLPVRPFGGNFQSSSGGHSDNETEDDQDYAEAFSNLNNEPYYRHTDRRGAKQLLQGLENGAFLFRPSKTSFLALTIKWDDKFYNINIQKNSNLIQCHTVPGSISPGFSSLETFIKHFEKNPLLLKHKDDICEVYLKCLLPSNRF